MKKTLLLMLTALLLAVTTLTSAGAEGTLAYLYDTLETLVFDTDHVAVNVTATFSLDGQLFKRANATHIQCGSDFFRDIYLLAPVEGEDEEFENGYTLLSRDGELESISSFDHAIFIRPDYSDRKSIIRRTVGFNSMVGVGRGAAVLAEMLLPEDTVKTMDDGTTVIHLAPGQSPAAVDAVLMQLLQYAGERTRYIMYSSMPYEARSWDIDAYQTVTEGLLFRTQEVQLKQVDVTIRQDDAGHISEISGQVMLNMYTGGTNVHELSVDFCMTTTDYGTAQMPDFIIERDSRWHLHFGPMEGVEDFDPSDYDVELTADDVYSMLTEVYSYDPSELDSFVLEPTEGGVIFYQADHPDWVYVIWAPAEAQTPFATDYVKYPGEGSVRYFMWTAHEQGWPNKEEMDNIRAFMDDFIIEPNDQLAAYMNGAQEWTKEQFVREVFRSCYGPEDGWSEPLTEWCEEACKSFGEQ